MKLKPYDEGAYDALKHTLRIALKLNDGHPWPISRAIRLMLVVIKTTGRAKFK